MIAAAFVVDVAVALAETRVPRRGFTLTGGRTAGAPASAARGCAATGIVAGITAAERSIVST